MSLKTWKKEFYPKDADEVSAKNSIAHSLRKWQGLTKTNLKKHDLHQVESVIGDEDEFNSMEIDDSSCALCQTYIDNDYDYDDDVDSRCHKCPLYQYLGTECDDTSTSPYIVWVNRGNAVPMINALKQTLKISNKRSKK